MARSVASASSKKKSKKAQKNMDTSIVEAYLAQLEAALGKADPFASVVSRIKADPAMGQAEVVALASRFVAPMAPSTSKKRALERIVGRHESLITFQLKRRAVGGRSAA